MVDFYALIIPSVFDKNLSIQACLTKFKCENQTTNLSLTCDMNVMTSSKNKIILHSKIKSSSVPPLSNKTSD